jgi:acyl carrier protein
MNSTTIVPKVIDVIARTQHIPADSISPEQTFQELGIDSLRGLLLITELENEFGVEVPNGWALSIRDIPQTIEVVSELLRMGAPGERLALN